MRVSDEFMRAVEDGTDFALRGRKNGEEMVAHQASERGGVVRVAVVKTRGEAPGAADETKVHARGRAVSVLKGEILGDGFEAEEA